DLANGMFNDVTIQLDQAEDLSGYTVTVTIEDATDGSVHVPFDAMFIEGMKFDGAARVAFGARTGGAADDYDIDNVSVSFGGGGGEGGGQLPGDMNQDGKLDISDAPALLGHLFLGTFPLLPCQGGDRTAVDPGPANLSLLDSNGDAKIDLSDVVRNLNFLFLGGQAPVLGTACVRIVDCPDVCTP
ncbi:MAG TPA: hypothetical protein VFD71_11095, partial [Planctomycetota bacterium]|nr:hypothetical protein [Planctomycetota bacterium]